VIMHLTEMVYAFLFSYLRYAPVYIVQMRCPLCSTMYTFSVLLCLDYANICNGLCLFI
jgi:hypothetical protein